MNIYSLLSIISAIIYIETAVIVLYQNRASNASRWFFVLCISYFIWSVSYIFYYSAPDESSVKFWDKVGSIGWISFPVLMIKFFSVISRQQDKLKAIKYVFAIHVLTALYLYYIIFTGDLLAEKFYKHNDIWFFTPLKSEFHYWLFYFYIFTSSVSTLVIMYFWKKDLTNKNERSQYRISLTTLILFISWGYLTDIMLPMLKLPLLPNMAHIFSMIWIGGTAYAMSRYNLLSLNPDLASNHIIEQLKEIFFFVSKRGKIIRSNIYTELVTGYKSEEIKNTPITSLFLEKEFVKTYLQRISLEKGNESFEVTLISKSGESIPVIISSSLLRDPYNDIRGFIIFGHDNRESLRLKNEIIVRQQAANHLQRIKEELEKRVKARNDELIKSYKELQVKITERREVEDLIKADIIEKEILIDEINNRVKNNMNLIITMIDTLSSNESHPEVKLKYKELSQRVKAILLIQKNLYLSLSYAEIDFGNFIVNVTENLLDFYQASEIVEVDFKVSGVFLNIDYAIPCGIVVNELISNALKHAFIENQPRKKHHKNILFIGYESNNQDYTLTISDNGKGLPIDFDLKEVETIGLQLVDILVNDQINGSIELLKTRGTSFIIRFSTKKQE